MDPVHNRGMDASRLEHAVLYFSYQSVLDPA